MLNTLQDLLGRGSERGAQPCCFFASLVFVALFFFVFRFCTPCYRPGIAGRTTTVAKNKKPTGGIEPPTFRLQSECSTTKLSRRTRDISRPARLTYRNPPIAQLAERETVDGLTTDISRSLVRIRVGGYIFIYFFDFFPLASTPCLLPRPGAPGGK